MPASRILHLVGSAQDDFYAELSRLYASDCLAATADCWPHAPQIAYITPDRRWRFPRSLEPIDIAVAQPLAIAEAISHLRQQNIDLMLPQMFCLPGMTDYRALFDLLQVPYIGNPPDAMALSAHKARAKAVAAAAGIPVPPGELLRPGDIPTLSPPVVVKPATADNSLGVTLVEQAANFPTALETAFAHAREVLVETYIPLGREVRCGVICRHGQLVALPLEEYAVHPQDHPIRNYADKLSRSATGELSLVAKAPAKAWIVAAGDPIIEPVQALAKSCHLALGCRHYSLFDFRIDPQGQPWFLEAGLYCSFAPRSVIVTMARAAGIELGQLLTGMIEEL
jgi:D-alanine-D-alanine ligase